MTRTAMIMAAGSGTRMASSGVPVPKVLVEIAGIPLLERNLRMLVRHGFDDIVVAVPLDGPVARFAETRLAGVAAAAGVRLETVRVPPLGNVGALRFLGDREGPSLVVFADNLTTLDLRAIHDAHRPPAAMTVAVHDQVQVNPFGEVVVSGGLVTAYREKPARRTTIASGVTMVSAGAVATIGEEAIGLGELVERMIARGLAVRAYPHQAEWIDVNDGAAVSAAEAMVAAHRAAFDMP